MEIRTCSRSEGKTWRFNISSPYTSPCFHNALHSIQVYNSATMLLIIVYERDTRRREREEQEKLSCKSKSKVLLCTGVDSLIEEKYFFFSVCFRGRIYNRSMRIKWLLNENKRKIIREAELSPAHIRNRKKHDICVSFASYFRFQYADNS